MAHEERMQEYQAIGAAIASGVFDNVLPEGGCSHRTLTIGMQVEQLLIEFWMGVEADPPSSC